MKRMIEGNLERVVLDLFSNWLRSSGYLVNLSGKVTTLRVFSLMNFHVHV